MQHALDTRRVLSGQGQPRRTQDDSEHVVEIVRQATGQLAERFELLRLEQLGTHRIELQRRFAPVGDIPGDLGQTDDLPKVIADHIQRRQCPELRAVLAHAPPLILRHTLFQRLAQQAFRAPFGTILRGEEQREMLADHFIGAIALDTFGAGVPGHHVPGRIKHVDGVVHHRLNQLFVTVRGHGRVVDAVS
ncbi:hypothetical protein D3C81_1461080 [compost metagenome]